MAHQLYRSFVLLISAVMGLSLPVPVVGTPLFDLSPQIDTISKIDSSSNSLPEIATRFDQMTTLQDFEQAFDALPNAQDAQQQAVLLISLQHAMIRLLMPLMSMIKRYQAYWQEQLQRPYSYFLSKPPHKWFKGKPPKEDLQDTLKVLSIIEGNIAEHIGMLKNNIDEYETIQSKQALQETVEQQQAFLVTFFGDTPQSDFGANNRLICTGFKQYHNTMYDLIRQHKRAGHFSRNWIAYTTAGLCLFATACWYLKNPKTNKAWIQQVYTENKNALSYMKQCIIDQITEIKNKWFSPAPLPINTTILEANDVTIARNNLLAIETYINILKENKKLPIEIEQKYQALLKDQTIENMKKFSDEYLATLQTFCIKTISEQNVISKSSSLVHLVSNAFIPHGLAKANTLFKEFLAPLIQRTDQTAQKIELIMPLVVLTPVFLTVYASFNALKFTYNKLAPHKVAHKGILTVLLQVEELLNDHADNNALDTKALGWLTYHLGMLYEYAQDLSLQEHCDFCKDLNKICKASRSIAQKLKDIEIIRKKYQFLA